LYQGKDSGRLIDPTSDVETNYFAGIQQYSYNKYEPSKPSKRMTIHNLYVLYRDTNSHSNLKITYTAMHGVGAPWVTKAFEV